VFSRSGGVWKQQGEKLLALDSVGPYSDQGSSVSLSADGDTALIGGNLDDNQIGGAWVFTRTANSWSQQGPKLVGSGATGAAQKGACVALSADGDTAIVGGPFDDGMVGAVWIFVRTENMWKQQGSKLVGRNAVGCSFQCHAALSADGNTAIVGGIGDDTYVGAAWVFLRSGAVWSQEGNKLVGTGRAGPYSDCGVSVALPADGNTALVGGSRDDDSAGAAWVYVREYGVWRQQGEKLTRRDAVGKAMQGYSVALSGDGYTALVGGHADNAGEGAAWIYTRLRDGWVPRGDKLVGAGAFGKAAQGYSVALSSDATTALLDGIYDYGESGAVWPFVNPRPLHRDRPRNRSVPLKLNGAPRD
jgi:hypothetical protein